MTQTRITRRHCLAAGSAGILSTLGLPAFADAWPSRVIKMVVAFPAGGPTDTAARIVSQKLAERLGVSIVVENKPGASGSIGTAAFIKSPADGYTLSMFGMPALLAPILYKTTAYDPTKDFQSESVATVYDLPMGIVVNPSLLPEVDSLKALVARAKASKVPMNYTSSGAGSFGHLAMEQLKDLGSFEMQHVPYRGSAPAVADLLGGQVGVMFADLVAALPHIKAGKLRAIALSSPKAAAMLPGVKTVSEQGFPSFDFDSWGGLIAPAGTPAAVVARVSKEVAAILAEDKEIQAKLLSAGAIAAYQPGDAMQKRLVADHARWSKVVREKGISAT
ncbi:tripartite tricarboxylate transporter substrate binding protein [Ramlibacter sp.]|uniref:Bug family tripartite tricarboxylate transporter substrate binding protein n=1 Tax=Ramlibacter sp. TaxID=1917967 RepID=UPI002C83C08E|nr:tripartite tricarboxylate transporter substrate binding protein [Ramlibacter sp.]HWI81957.1 tripartite tricarboxylate transporter substrate binding protein [Ramlibacter sp.]